MNKVNFRKPKQNRRNSSTQNRSANKRKNGRPLDVSLLQNKAHSGRELQFLSERAIVDLPVDQSIITNLLKKGYSSPTEIQDRAIEPILKGHDLMGLAQTGTGKTGAFLIPLIHNLIGVHPAFQVLIIAPTRELAVQTEKEFKSLTVGMRLFSECLIGGTSVNNDLRKLRKPCHFIIGTPGRIMDMVRQKAIDLNDFSILVLDEFDRLLDMGFSQDILWIADGMSNRKQTILFSATENKSQSQIVSSLLTKPIEVRLKVANFAADNIEQDIIKVTNGENKIDILLKLIRDPSFEKVLIFADTKRWVSTICEKLRKAGIKADEIHGDKSQNYRLNALEAFRRRKIQVLVATDVAARGLDIDDVSHVINYQHPQNMENYIHRIGRTGRAGKSGKAYTFVN
jgi:ATP-dependent RNA helicase RhlE